MVDIVGPLFLLFPANCNFAYVCPVLEVPKVACVSVSNHGILMLYILTWVQYYRKGKIIIVIGLARDTVFYFVLFFNFLTYAGPFHVQWKYYFIIKSDFCY